MREEFNRADALENDKRAGTVGFALTILQRRLASSPEAIYQSLRRRRERPEGRLRELEVLQRGGQAGGILTPTAPVLDAEDVEDLEDAPDNEVEAAEEEILDQATAARSIAELKAEIETLKGLESLALTTRRSGTDTKWRQLERVEIDDESRGLDGGELIANARRHALHQRGPPLQNRLKQTSVVQSLGVGSTRTQRVLFGSNPSP